MVVLAPLSSLTLPSGRAKPLVWGEVDGDPAASTSLILPSGRTEPLVRGEGEPGGVASPHRGVSQESGLLGWYGPLDSLVV